MKKLIVAVLLFAVCITSAFAEETVPPPAQPGNGTYSYNPATGAPQSAAAITASGVRRAVAKGLKSLTGKNGAITRVENQTKANAEAIKNLTAPGGKIDKIGEDAKGARQDIQNLNEKLTGEKGWLAAINANANSAGEAAKETDRTLLWTTLIILVVIIIATIIMWKSIGNVHVKMNSMNNQVYAANDKIDRLSGAVADKVKALDPMTIPVTFGVHSYTFIPVIKDGMYQSLYVPAEGITPVADPSQIVRKPISDKGKLVSSTRSVLAKHAAWVTAGKQALTDEQEKQQMALVEHLLGTPELKKA